MAWFGQKNFCAVSFSGFRKCEQLKWNTRNHELIEAHHIVCQAYARENPDYRLNGVPLLRAVHATNNGLPIKQSLHVEIHQKAKSLWQVPIVTQELVQKYFESNYGFLNRIPFLPGISLGERWKQYLLSKSLIYLPEKKSLVRSKTFTITPSPRKEIPTYV
jgi:hypothetical protein